MSHSILAPSSAHIWGKPNGCTGWVGMSANYPEDTESEAAKEGTAAHELAEIMIGMSAIETVTPNSATTLIGAPMSNGVIVSQEMVEAAWDYADDVVRISKRSPHVELHIEERLHARSVHPEHSWGTPDAWTYDPVNKIVHIWDFKYGFGVVEAYENWQLINYAAGILDTIGEQDRDVQISMRIVQPRAFHRDGTIRKWDVKASELRGHINTLANNALTALSSDAEVRSGEHCRYCTARHACTAALRAGMSLYETVNAPTPVELSNEAMGVQLALIKRARKQLEYLESGFEEQIKGKIRSGSNIPGWTVSQGVGRERWAKPIAEVVALGDMMGKDLRKPIDAITPSQAKKLGIDGALIEMYSEKPHTGLKLTPVDNKAKRVFT